MAASTSRLLLPIAGLFLLILAPPSFAIAAAAVAPITIGETFTLISETLGEERAILVSPPPGYARTDDRFQVLYLLDGTEHLVHARGTVDFLARNGLMPQLIIVGIANTDRTRDLTPTRPEVHIGVDGLARDLPSSGGADRFLDFLQYELVPRIETGYRTLPYRVLVGHSFGGLCTLHAFTARPDLFGACMAISPTLRWDDEFPLRRLAAFLARGESRPRTLFVAMADEEAGDPGPTRFERLRQMLASASVAGLRASTLHLPHENHGTVVLPALFEGLQQVYDGWNLPRDPHTRRLAAGLEEVLAHHRGLSERFGYTVEPSEMELNQVGYHALGRGDVEDAIAIFRHNATVHPDSANPRDSLGEALERAGRLEEALREYEAAAEIAGRRGDARADLYEANRDRLRERITATTRP
ncbi:MAG: alpha/beta hydrolase-fold protein [Candidatus Krumholzibacteriia bacterium]